MGTGPIRGFIGRWLAGMSLRAIGLPVNSIKDPQSWLALLGQSKSGVQVNAERALAISTVYACVRILSESIASLPLKLYQATAGGREEARGHPLYGILKEEPNGQQTSFEFREMLQGHLCLRGNAYARVIRNGRYEIEAILPLHPDKVQVLALANGELAYRVEGEPRVLVRGDVLPLRGLSADGRVGLSPLWYLREPMGIAIAAEEHGARFFSNGSAPAGVLQTEMKLTDDQYRRLREAWESRHAGSGNAGRTAILDSGLKWQAVGMTNEDAQFLETRRFQVEEIARAFRVPLHLLNSTEKSTTWGSGIEQMNLGFIEYTLRPWLVRWEQALNTVLLTAAERASGLYCEFNLNALLRGDFVARMDGYTRGIEAGIYTLNEVRALENLNRLPGRLGDQHFRPLNSGALGANPN